MQHTAKNNNTSIFTFLHKHLLLHNNNRIQCTSLSHLKKHYWLTLAIALQQLQATIWLYSSIIQAYLFDVKVLERRSLNHTRHGVTFTAPKLGKIYSVLYSSQPTSRSPSAARRGRKEKVS